MQGRALTTFELWYGRNSPPPKRTALRAGPVTAVLEEGDLRDVRFFGVELIRRLYVALRDENWDTIPAELTAFAIEACEDSFRVSFEGRHRNPRLDYRWRGSIEGDASGRISYSMTGQALRDFPYCRIGFCVLHPPGEYAGQPYAVSVGEQGSTGRLPMHVGPQRLEGDVYYPLFPSFSSLSVQLRSGVEAAFSFEGDLFEMEDQRNWTDGSFKTYCTPLALGYPHQATAGQLFTQTVRVHATGRPQAGIAKGKPVVVSVGARSRGRLPRLGLGLATHDVPLSPRDHVLLRSLSPDHLRVDLHLSDPTAGRCLARAVEESRAVGCGLELALFCGDDPERELAALVTMLPLALPVERVLVFQAAAQVTPSETVCRARAVLAPQLPGVPIGGGTNIYFAELNRSRPDIAALELVAFSINPQVHASDELSLVENLEAQRDALESARAFCAGLPLVVSPVTLKPRFNPDAAGPELPASADQLPPAVDARQMSLFAAAWTLGSVKQLAEGNAASVTYYETTGWRGIKETARGSPVSALFPSSPDLTFPVFHILADVADLRTGRLLECASSAPLYVQALAVETDRGVHLLVANLTPEDQRVALRPIAGERVMLRRLDAGTAPLAMQEPELFREPSRFESQPVSDCVLALTLTPYSVVRIEPA
jgi:D-apionolactonase